MWVSPQGDLEPVLEHKAVNFTSDSNIVGKGWMGGGWEATYLSLYAGKYFSSVGASGAVFRGSSA